MNLHIGHSIPTGSRKWFGKEALAAVCGLAVTVAALAGIGAWRSSTHDTTRKPAQLTAPISAPVATGSAQRARPFTYYLVGSPDDARWVEAGLDAELASFTATSRALADHDVVAINSPEDETQLRSAISDAQRVAEDSGQVESQTEDLRPYLAGNGDSSTLLLPGADDGMVVYVVGSPEQAHYVRLQLDNVAARVPDMALFWTERGPAGLPATDLYGEEASRPGAVRFAIAVVSSSGDLDDVGRAVAELPDAQLIDLRAP